MEDKLIEKVRRIANGFKSTANPESAYYDDFLAIVTARCFSSEEWEKLKSIGKGKAPYTPIDAEAVPDRYDWDLLEEDEKMKYNDRYDEYAYAMEDEASELREAIVTQANEWLDGLSNKSKIIVRTKKQSCSNVKAWVYQADDADDEDLNDGDSDYREFASDEEALEYFEDDAELETKNSNELWRKNVAAAAIEALGMTYKVVSGGKVNYFATISEARDYLVEVEDSCVHSDADGARLSIRVEGIGKATGASLTLADGEMWQVEKDDFELFADGELL